MKAYIQYKAEGENEITQVSLFDYLEYYEANIHPYTEIILEEGNKRVYEGITVGEFLLKHKDEFAKIPELVFKNERLSELQYELKEKEGKQVCMFNMCVLAKYLIERGKSRYVFLLKPTIPELLSALDDVSKITFTNKDGTIVESTSNILIKKVKEVLEAEKESNAMSLEIEKVVTWDKVSNNSIMMSYFVHDLTMFLNRYFPGKRKKDALISTKEVELILYLMELFKLSTTKLTNKRYWQLMKTYKEASKYEADLCEIPFYKGVYVPIFFLPYSVWHKGKLDWTEDEIPLSHMKDGIILSF